MNIPSLLKGFQQFFRFPLTQVFPNHLIQSQRFQILCPYPHSWLSGSWATILFLFLCTSLSLSPRPQPPPEAKLCEDWDPVCPLYSSTPGTESGHFPHSHSAIWTLYPYDQQNTWHWHFRHRIIYYVSQVYGIFLQTGFFYFKYNLLSNWFLYNTQCSSLQVPSSMPIIHFLLSLTPHQPSVCPQYLRVSYGLPPSLSVAFPSPFPSPMVFC